MGRNAERNAAEMPYVLRSMARDHGVARARGRLYTRKRRRIGLLESNLNKLMRGVKESFDPKGQSSIRADVLVSDGTNLCTWRY